MELLNDDYKPLFTPKEKYKPKSALEQKTELENFDRKPISEDFSDSKFLDK